MNCTESRQTIDRLPPHAALEGALKTHLAACSLCQHYYGERALTQRLADLRVPEPSSDFLEKAMRRAVVEAEAREAHRSRRNWRWPAAIAASAFIAVVGWFSLTNGLAPQDVDRVVQAQPANEETYRKEVRILIRSQQDWDDAEVTVELAEDLELEGFAGEHLVAWNTKLNKGTNLLTLPILVRNNGGQIRVRSHYGDTRHEVQVQVAPKDKSSSVAQSQADTNV